MSSVFANASSIKKEDYMCFKRKAIASKCDIVRKDVYNYCINHGFTVSEATDIANASLSECKKVSTNINAGN